MKNSGAHIQEFDISPAARAGVFIIDLKEVEHEENHNVHAPHRDTHYLLLMALEGRFRLMLDFEDLLIDAPAMLLIQPGQVHQVHEIRHPEGWSISFDPSLIDDEAQQLLADGFAAPVALENAGLLQTQLVTLLKLLLEIQGKVPNKFIQKAMHELLRAALSLISAGFSQPESNVRSNEKRGIVIVHDFNRLLNRHFKEWKQPAQYAGALSISTAHLNDRVKSLSGFSVSTQIQRKSILEAKRLLYFTDLSVREIGYETGYDDPVYFSKLFKKLTALTPLEFRKQFRD